MKLDEVEIKKQQDQLHDFSKVFIQGLVATSLDFTFHYDLVDDLSVTLHLHTFWVELSHSLKHIDAYIKGTGHKNSYIDGHFCVSILRILRG